VEIYWFAGGAVLVAALMASFRVQLLQQRRLARLDERMAHLSAGISLLTDTAEGGLRDIALEIERLAAAGAKASRPKARAATQRRVSTASRRGRSVQDIAAKEKMSEGEVRLHLKLADAAGREKAHATVR
jgi:DNA-binding NarL/FixJ family response regulator